MARAQTRAFVVKKSKGKPLESQPSVLADRLDYSDQLAVDSTVSLCGGSGS